MVSKLAAKMYRMKMLSDVREFVENLPFEIVEKQADNCVYVGVGEVDTGLSKFLTVVKIVPDNKGNLSVIVSAPKAGINEEIPFNTEDQRKKAPKLIGALMPRYLN